MSAAALNGKRCTSARATIPAWGCWFADVSVDGEHTITGAATLKIADLTLVGTILSGGAQHGRSTFRMVAGAGGWGQTIPEKPYANDAQVKHATVIGDAAAECGETVATISSTLRTGPAYVRQEGPASSVLNLLAPEAWYIDEAGTTRLGARAAGALVGKVTRIAPIDKALGKVVLAADSIATILPGVVVDGMTAVDVTHEITADGGLRSTVWGSAMPSALDAFRDVLDAVDPWRRYRGVTEYRVGALESTRLSLQPVRVSTGMPFLSRVPMWPGVSGCYATVALGSRVLVGFIDSDPGRPYVAAFEDVDGEGFTPTLIKLGGGSDFVALAALVSSELSELKSAISGAATVPNDGGSAFKTAVVAALAAWPGSVAATKVKAT